jgi:hypothetical protein
MTVSVSQLSCAYINIYKPKYVSVVCMYHRREREAMIILLRPLSACSESTIYSSLSLGISDRLVDGAMVL